MLISGEIGKVRLLRQLADIPESFLMEPFDLALGRIKTQQFQAFATKLDNLALT
jgi:hypothetical protein